MSIVSTNIRHFRLQKGYSRRRLAMMAGLSAQSITHYESGQRLPRREILDRLALALGIDAEGLLRAGDAGLVFVHEPWPDPRRPGQACRQMATACIEAAACRLHAVARLLGGSVLPDAPTCRCVPPSASCEEAAARLRRHLGLPPTGPVADLTSLLEDRGMPVHALPAASGIASTHGLAGGRPYLAVNEGLSCWERRRALASETARLLFLPPVSAPRRRTEERQLAAIADAFFLPAADLRRDLGTRRTSLAGDASDVCRKYGIPFSVLAWRAWRCRVISRSVMENAVRADTREAGRRTREEEPAAADAAATSLPRRPEAERPGLLRRLALRACAEHLLAPEETATLAGMELDEVRARCL